MNDHLPKMTTPDEELDEVLVLNFLADTHELEEALVRAGFTRAGQTPRDARPDWEQFALHIEGKFEPESRVELEMAVVYLLADPVRESFRRERLADSILGEPSKPHSDIVWLAELVQEIRNRLLGWINFRREPGCEDADVMAALFVVQAWSHLDPQVENLLVYVH
jgi:hypothetical protein